MKDFKKIRVRKYRNTLWERVDTGLVYDYFVGENGLVFKRAHKTLVETLVTPYLKKGHATLKINGKEYTLKNLVAKHYLYRKWKPNTYVECVDGDPFNCCEDNLRLYSKSEHGKRTAPQIKAIPVVVNGVYYNSVRSAAKSLFVSYQTLLDYLAINKIKHSVLEGTSVAYAN